MKSFCYLSTAALLVISLSCSDTAFKPSTGGDGSVGTDLRVGDGGGNPKFDGSEPGTNCHPENTGAIYTPSESISGWTPLPQLSWVRDQYVVAWTGITKENSRLAYRPMFIRVSKDGTASGSAVEVTASATLASPVSPPVVTERSEGFAIFWTDNRDEEATIGDIYMARFNSQGEPAGEDGKACSGAGCAEVKLTSSGYASMPNVTRRSFVDIEGPTVVSDIGIAWRDGRNGSPDPYGYGARGDIYFKVIHPDTGADIVAEKRITTEESNAKAERPRLSFSESLYALAWTAGPKTAVADQQLIYTTLGTDGTIITPEKSFADVEGNHAIALDLVWAKNEFGLLFLDSPDPGSTMVRFSRIVSDGSLLATQNVNSAGNPCSPAVAFNGKNYGAVWQDNCGKDGSKLMFALIGANGRPLKPDGTACGGNSDDTCGLVQISFDGGVPSFPQLISVNGKFAVVWQNVANSVSEKRLYFSHIVCD